jgi:N-methylhydantoinase A
MSRFDADIAGQIFTELQGEATRFVRSCDATAPIAAEFKVYMRYAGQGWEIPVPLTGDAAEKPDAATFLARFEADYSRLFGRVVDGMEVEITVWSVNAATPSAPVMRVADANAAWAPVSVGQRALFDAALGQEHPANIYERKDFTPGAWIVGPALITEDETTIVIPTSRTAMALADGCIDMTDKGGHA